MKRKTMILALVAAGLSSAVGYGLYAIGMRQGMSMAAPAAVGNTPGTTAADSSTGKEVLYWQDPMVPGQKFDKPGKSPYMDMQLVPVYGGDAGDKGKVTISSRVQQNLGVRTADVTKGSLNSAVAAVGSVAYNERDVALVQARSNGFVERLYVRAPLDPVKKGQPLAELFVPEWVAAQEEYLSVKRMGNGVEGLVDGARQRMRLVGMTDDQIRLVASSGKIQSRMTITAPISGVVTELAVREGMTVMAGAALFRINGLGTVWVNAEVPENFAAQVRPGNTVEARSASLPGTVLTGKVGTLLPEVNAATRTLKARIELANPGNQLIPGMFVTVSITPASRKEVLLVPSEAVIQTGQRSVVMTALGNGKFMPADVETGAETNGQTEIRKGLEAGQKVVVSGQFLIDSEASLKGTATRMSDSPAADNGKAPGPTHHGVGTVEKIDKNEIMISHGPISSLQWSAMTMGFSLPASGLPKNVAVGDTVNFEFRPLKAGVFEIVSILPTAAPRPAMQEKTTNGTMKQGTSGTMKDDMKNDGPMPGKPAGAAK